MNRARQIGVGIAALTLIGLLPAVASAQRATPAPGRGMMGPRVVRPMPGQFPIGRAGVLYRGSSSLYNLGHIPVPPYFALHPPVYYGDRVYRSYGDSPFAWSGDARPSVSVETPSEVLNHHVVPIEPQKAAELADPVAHAPREILNPFFDRAQLVQNPQ